ncbi:MAG: hypothetical protein JJU20_00340 [Opitutales bacterium]|nr:hypothetical protein [Opitutales bacterium]
MDNKIELTVFIVYLVFLVAMGIVFSRWSKGTRDYFISGSKAAWWLVGMSAFMSGISAYTFTGNAGIAFEAGWTITIMFLGSVLAYILNGFFLAHLFRQTRCVTFPEIARERFGRATELTYSFIGVINFPLGAGIGIWAVSAFISAISGWPLEWLIVSLGIVVLVYSTTGGRWAVMSTDFIQGIVVVALSIYITILCMIEIGGIQGFINKVNEKGLADQFAFINPPEIREDGVYGPLWIFVTTLVVIAVQCSFQVSTRYFSAKDGRSARKAAFLGAALILVGSIVWFIPPMTARLLFEEQVMTMGQLSAPRESAFAIISMNLLPTGMIGMMIVAMMAASMSTLDTGLNNSSAIVIRNLFPAMRRLLGTADPTEKQELLLSRLTTILLGLAIITSALYFASVGGRGMFEIGVNLLAIVGLPMAIPMILAIFIRRIPQWGIFLGLGLGILPSVMSLIFSDLFNYQTRTLWIFIGSTSGTLISIAFWRYTNEAFRKQTREFFIKLHTPIDFEAEVGEPEDILQLKRIGFFSICVGVFILSLLILPNPIEGRLGILGIGLLIGGIGLAMMHASRRARLRALKLVNETGKSSGK